MGIKRPLVNPLPSENTDNITLGKVYRPSRDQMHLPIEHKETALQSFFKNTKVKIKQRLEYIDVEQIWKSPAIPLMIVTSIFNFLIWFVGGIFAFNQLPQEIQFTYDVVQQTWIREDKFIVIVIAPILYLIAFLIQLKLIDSVFKKDRRLALAISWIITLLNLLLLIAIGQIYSLIFSK
jgi:hypothetical protein